jgi:hypothetical protein
MSFRTLGALMLAAPLVLAGECAWLLPGMSISDIVSAHKAKITVQNTGTEMAFVVVYADDAHAAGNLGPGGSIGIETHVDGSYTVVVRGSGAALGEYQDDLASLRNQTKRLHEPDAYLHMTLLRAAIADTKQSLRAVRDAPETLGSCSGGVSFPEPDPENPAPPIRITATVTSLDGEIWATNCP